MIEALGLIVLTILTVAVLLVGYSLRRWMKRCFHELKVISAELDRIRDQLGIPQHAVYRLVAARGVPEPPRPPGKLPDDPNPA